MKIQGHVSRAKMAAVTAEMRAASAWSHSGVMTRPWTTTTAFAGYDG